ncbi:hypothetical protein PROH_18475 [Prochlorothrix hollandica PCC 9006 = CALU 1027]|uniref:Uncharacterized protein n=1 Tax=Prochlorothrix hollandica PCC 9006 = CALU 1027 TaxID=317619 RepID=A0A0M2PTG6_PROHO|nr:hypothetical protein PROH_18475 [Prochlorothrix hollandica PCC 9006 = CALU 1027]
MTYADPGLCGRVHHPPLLNLTYAWSLPDPWEPRSPTPGRCPNPGASPDRPPRRSSSPSPGGHLGTGGTDPGPAGGDPRPPSPGPRPWPSASVAPVFAAGEPCGPGHSRCPC